MSRFLPPEAYNSALAGGYDLLPFRFMSLEGETCVLTNMAGEYALATRQTVRALVGKALRPGDDVYEELRTKHFLIDQDSSVGAELLALKVRTRHQRLAQFTGLHIFVVSLRCEHSCPYCQVSRQSDDRVAFDMTGATASKALDLVFRSPSPAIKVEFQGGESLLNFPLIRFIVERAEALNVTEKRDLQFVIATNLAVVTDDMLEYCRDRGILISTSLDGPADLHNANRPRPGRDSYQRAVAGIDRARQMLGHDRVSALMTTTQASLSRVRDIVDEYRARGFGGIFLRALSPYGFAIKTKTFARYDTDEWLRFYVDGLRYIVDLNKAGEPFVEHYAATVLAKMLTPFNTGYVDLMSPAGIGLGALVYNYDGDVYASDESRMLAEMGDKTFRLGNVHADSYEAIIGSDALLDPLEQSFAASAPMCSDCAFEPYCGADPVFHHATQHDYVGRKPHSAFCSRNMEIFRTLIWMMEDDHETKRIFRRWAGR